MVRVVLLYSSVNEHTLTENKWAAEMCSQSICPSPHPRPDQGTSSSTRSFGMCFLSKWLVQTVPRVNPLWQKRQHLAIAALWLVLGSWVLSGESHFSMFPFPCLGFTFYFRSSWVPLGLPFDLKSEGLHVYSQEHLENQCPVGQSCAGEECPGQETEPGTSSTRFSVAQRTSDPAGHSSLFTPPLLWVPQYCPGKWKEMLEPRGKLWSCSCFQCLSGSGSGCVKCERRTFGMKHDYTDSVQWNPEKTGFEV